MTVETRRKPADVQPLPLDLFTDQIAAALHAFRHDVSYACAIAKAAVNIDRKRQRWQSRREQA